MLKQRIITALLLVSILLAALFAENPTFWRCFISLVVAVAFWEWLRFCDIHSKLEMLLSFVLFAAVFYLLQAGYSPMLMTVAAACIVWCALLLFTTRNWFLILHNKILKLLIGTLVLSVAGWLVIELREIEHGALWIVCFLVAVFAADIGAFFVGRRIGKTKLAPSISPGKTVEGLLGGMAFVLILFVPLLFWNFSSSAASILLVTILATALISVGGDLFESKLKRHVGIKDSSNILPGHGGVLDRIDSLLAAVPFFVLGLLLLGYMS